MSDTLNTDAGRQVNAGNGVYDPSDRAKAAARGAQAAGSGSSVVSLDGSAGSGAKGSQAQKEVQPKSKPDKQVDNVTNPAGTDSKPVGNTGQTGTDKLGSTTSINDRKV